MNYPLPPWLNPPDPVAPYMQGIGLGQRQAIQNVQIQEQQQAAQQASLMQAARLAHAQQIEAQRSHDEQAGQAIEASKQQFLAADSAKQYADLQGFKADVAAGITPDAAVMRHPYVFGSKNANTIGTIIDKFKNVPKAEWAPAQGGAPAHYNLPSGAVSYPPASSTPVSNTMTPLTDPNGNPIPGQFSFGGKHVSVSPDKSVAEAVKQKRADQAEVFKIETDLRLNRKERASLEKNDIRGQTEVEGEFRRLTNRLKEILNPQAVGATPTPVAPKSAAPAVVPLPKTKSELKKGVTYSTPKGDWMWDGDKLVKP